MKDMSQLEEVRHSTAHVLAAAVLNKLLSLFNIKMCALVLFLSVPSWARADTNLIRLKALLNICEIAQKSSDTGTINNIANQIKDIDLIHLFQNVLSANQNSKDLEIFLNSIASKKGTTQAGVNFLKSQNIKKTIYTTLDKAYKRAKEIGIEK